MARFTKALREQIVREFASRHNGRFDPAIFVDEVRAAGAAHAAYEWFEWDDEAAASAHRIDQAREFIQGIQISFIVETVERGKVVVQQTVAPMAISPISTRREGGGYTVTDPSRPDHMQELCSQASADLAAWLRRYEGTVIYAGGKVADVQKLADRLTAASHPTAQAA